MKNVSFIPSPMDSLASSHSEAARQNPLRLILRDVGILIKNLTYLPWIILPFRTKDKSAELYMSLSKSRENIVQGWLFLVETLLLFLSVPAFLILPGVVSILASALCCVVISAICKLLQGSRVVHSETDEDNVARARQHEDERWIFINGCMTGHVGLQNNCNRLAKIFGRPIIGIHNRTYGLVADLIECILQRSLLFNTKDCRIACEYVKACLTDPQVRKVVLIGHSQGGIIASMVLDKLFADLAPEHIGKLEVYTFGSAASHFNNPLRDLCPRSSPSEPTVSNRCIPHIEHYCNELDMITRWGVLYNVTEILDNRYCGKVFVRLGASGHLFNQHYLDPMFPLVDSKARAADGGEDADDFLDQVVEVDVRTARKREDAHRQEQGVLREESSLQNFEFGNGDVMPVPAGVADGNVCAASPDLHAAPCEDGGAERHADAGPVSKAGINFVEPTHPGVAHARGKTVRELSRLWRYMGGKSPPPSPVASMSPTPERRQSRSMNGLAIGMSSQGVECMTSVVPSIFGGTG